MAASRLTRREDGLLEYRMKRVVGGRQVLVLTPVQLLRRLAAVCPPRGKHLVHFHGVLAPHARHRAQVVGWGRAAREELPSERQEELPLKEERRPRRRRRVDWVTLLRRTFAVDVLECPACGGRRKVLAAVTRRGAIQEALAARGLLRQRTASTPRSQGPPAQGAFAFAA